MNKTFMTMRQFAALMIAATACLVYLTSSARPQDHAVSAAGEAQQAAQIVLMDKEGVLIPYTVHVDQDLDLKQKAQQLTDWMMVNSETAGGMRGLLPAGTKILNCSREGQAMLVDFSQEFKNYDPKTELRLLESLQWSFLSLDEVEELQLSVEGHPLSHMPQAATPIPVPLNRTLGINNFEQTQSSLPGSKALTVFHIRHHEGKEVLVPKSVRYDRNADLKDILDLLTRDITSFDKMHQPLSNSGFRLLNYVVQDQLLQLNISGPVLDEEKKIDENLMRCFLLSVKYSLGFDKIQLSVDGIPVNLNGVNNDPIDLDSLKINELVL